jgi:gamma-glutamylcyclotransferase (GGCT)/AIG2-like uncharacterized protein YtfP
MSLLFSYGTLRQAGVQHSTFGRTLSGQQDQLLGYALSVLRVDDPAFVRTSGTANHAVVRRTGNPEDTVAGTAFELTDDELARADKYEPVEYKRVTADLASGRRAWVYVEANVSTDPNAGDA